MRLHIPYGSKTVLRHLKYAWIEYGDTADAQAFASGMAKLGWENLLTQLPTQKDSLGVRRVDSAHPSLPIRWKGPALLALPNAYSDGDVDPDTRESDPIFDAYVNAQGVRAWETEMGKIGDFLAQWAIAPGIKTVSPTEGRLTTDPSQYSDSADLVVVSGHGSAGIIWGGTSTLGCKLAISYGLHRTGAINDRLKYLLFASCANASRDLSEHWRGPLSRPQPLHGILGYRGAYPGGALGRTLMATFCAKLKTRPILDAWREAHMPNLSDRWAAYQHLASRKDTMNDWLRGALPTPPTWGEIRHYDESSWPDGEKVEPEAPPYGLRWHAGTTEIDRRNNALADVGLFPGESGRIVFESPGGPFREGNRRERKFTIIFYYFRPEKDGMDLNSLLEFGPCAQADVEVLTDHNKLDGTAHPDAIRVVPLPDVRQVSIPFTVRPEAHATFHLGYIWMMVVSPGEEYYSYYTDGAWLRKPRS